MLNNFAFEPVSFTLLVLGIIIFLGSCYCYNKTQKISEYINKNIFRSKIKDLDPLKRFIGFLTALGITIGLMWLVFGIIGLGF